MINPKSQIKRKTRTDRDEFWRIVAECLVKFHRVPHRTARSRTHRLRERIESAPRGISTTIFYHSEPFDVACDLAEKELDFIRFRERYECLLKQHGW